MTYENRKKRYDSFIRNSDKVRAEEISKKYPDVIDIVEEEPKVEVKSKGKK